MLRTSLYIQYTAGVDPGILERGGGQGPLKGRSVGIFKLTNKENSGGGGGVNLVETFVIFRHVLDIMRVVFSHCIFRDAIMVSVINCGTSVYAGFAIFSVIGFMAHTLGVPIETATASGR